MASTYELMLMALSAQLAVPVNAAPATSLVGGTPTTGTTEVFDSTVGFYQCALVAGRRYQAVMLGLHGNCGTAGDIYSIQIRNSGSSSNPTTSSTIVAQSQWTSTTTGSASRVPVPVANTFIAPTTGLNTFGISAVRLAGSGAFTPQPPNANGATQYYRELFVMYMGVV